MWFTIWVSLNDFSGINWRVKYTSKVGIIHFCKDEHSNISMLRFKAKIHTVPSPIFIVEATELGLRTLIFAFSFQSWLTQLFWWHYPLNTINVRPCSYRAETCDVHSLALISQVASYSNSNWWLLIETGGKLYYFHFMVQFLFFSVQSFSGRQLSWFTIH